MNAIPDTCETCGATKSHETLGLLIRGCVYQCGAAVASDASGHVYPALICRKALGIIAGLRAENSRLRADNVRLGDRGVLVAIAMLAAIESLEKSLRGWQAVALEDLPRVGLLDLAPLRAAYDELVDALEGAAPAPAAQPKVRIVRGGHRGELARITGAGMAGGFTVTTECGVALALAERDFVRLGA